MYAAIVTTNDSKKHEHVLKMLQSIFPKHEKFFCSSPDDAMKKLLQDGSFLIFMDTSKGKKIKPVITCPEIIELADAGGTHRVAVKNILHISAYRNYSTFFFTDKTQQVISKNIKEYADLLSAYGFLRTHLSHVINRHHIKEYQREDGGAVRMTDGTTVPIARNRKEEITRELNLR